MSAWHHSGRHVRAVVIAHGVIGCIDTSDHSGLVESGPPEIAQVRLVAAIADPNDPSGAPTTQRVFAFGTSPTATPSDEPAVVTAAASGQSLRIIIDQLLLGSRLEQIECRGSVALDADGSATAFSAVPDSATPDDIARCAGTSADLAQSCSGPNATCLCQIPGGCDGIALGAPVGVLDANGDGAADAFRMTPGAVQFTCSGFAVQTDLDASYWDPSGNQVVPPAADFDSLGPAIVLAPAGGNLPTSATCGIAFASTVVGKQGEQICAVPGGRPASCSGALADCSSFFAGCTPGDVSAVSFDTAPLVIQGGTIADGQTDVPIDQMLTFDASAALDAVSLAGVAIAPAPPGPVTVGLAAAETLQIDVGAPGLAPATAYTLTIPTTVTDLFGQPLAAPWVVHFTTIAAAADLTTFVVAPLPVLAHRKCAPVRFSLRLGGEVPRALLRSRCGH